MDARAGGNTIDPGCVRHSAQNQIAGDELSQAEVEVKLLRSLVCELMNVDANVLASTVRQHATASLQRGERKQHRLQDRSKSSGNPCDVSARPLPPVPEQTHESGGLSSGRGREVDRKPAELTRISAPGDNQRMPSVADLRDQIGLTVFREDCNTSRKQSLQSPSTLTSPWSGGFDYSVWTHRTSKWDIPRLAVMASSLRPEEESSQPPPIVPREHSSGNAGLQQCEWSELPGLPLERGCVAGVCHVVKLKDYLVVATTVRSEQAHLLRPSPAGSGAGEGNDNVGAGNQRAPYYRAAVFATDSSLRRWQPVAGPSVVTSHTLDGMCVEQLRSKLMLIVRPCRKSDGPNTVWSLDFANGPSPKSSWQPHCVVPAGHRCGTYAVVGNFLVAAGGKIGGCDSAAQRTVDAFDFTLGDWVSWPSLPHALYAAAAVVFNENYLVLCGGVLGRSITSWAADKGTDDHPESGRFESLGIEVHGDFPASAWCLHCYMKSPCLSPAASNVHGMLVVHHGGDEGSGELSRWDGGKKVWRRITKLPEACIDAAVLEFGGSLVVIGGEEIHNKTESLTEGSDHEHTFSTRVFSIKTLRRNAEALSDRRHRASEPSTLM